MPDRSSPNIISEHSATYVIAMCPWLLSIVFGSESVAEKLNVSNMQAKFILKGNF